ncbi:MAG: hypothetical protein WBE34_10280 [Candidatus Nitrosopolaris sp.]
MSWHELKEYRTETSKLRESKVRVLAASVHEFTDLLLLQNFINTEIIGAR